MRTGQHTGVFRKKRAPDWVMAPRPGARQAVLDFDFQNNRAWVNGRSVSLSPLVTISRASPATTYYENADGTVTAFAANTLRIGSRGVLVEPSRTNVVLWCRDLTNAAWTKTSCTAALDQTGPDGSANSASSLTASGSNATCLQAITLASSARWQSAYVKRISGSGAISMTTDGGTTWTAISITSAWARYEIPTQTLANPSVGFKIATSGDAIAVDFVQNENSGDQRSSPIPTTTVAVTRSIESPSYVIGDLIKRCPNGVTIYSQSFGNTPSNTTSGSPVYFDGDGGSLILAHYAASRLTTLGRDTAYANQWSIDVATSSSAINPGRHKVVQGLAYNNISICVEEAVYGIVDNSATIPSVTKMWIGNENSGGQYCGYIERIAIWNVCLPDADLKRLSAANTDFLVLVDGDSIPRSPSLTTCWPYVVQASLAPLTSRWDVRNVAQSSSSLGRGDALALDFSSRLSAQQDVLNRYCEANPNLKSCTVIFVGHNDKGIDGDSTSTFLSQYSSYLATLKAANRSGRHKLAIVHVPPSTTPADLNTWRATVNTALSGYAGVNCDYVVDLSAVSGCLDADASNTAIWSDGIHPTAAQSIVLANAIKTQALDLAAA